MKEVFKNPFYIVLSFAVFFLVVIFSIWLPNLSFIKHTAVSPDLEANQKYGILLASLGAINTNFTPIGRILLILVSFLFSIDFSLLIYYFQKTLVVEKSLGTGILGLVTGILGVGCASCGSVILVSVLGLTAASAFLSFLPLRGAEFGLISVAVLFYSIYLISKKISNPLFCKKT